MTIKFSNKNRVKPIGLFLSFLMMISVAGLASYYLWFSELGKSVEVALWLYFIFVSVFFYFGGYYYVEVEIGAAKVDVKYYNLFPFWRQYKRIMIPLDKLKYVKVRSGFGSFGASLVICGRLKGRIAMYPTVGLNACKREQVQLLKEFSKKYPKIKKQ